MPSKKVSMRASIANRPTCGGSKKAGLAPRSTNFMMGVKRNHHFAPGQPFKDDKESQDYVCNSNTGGGENTLGNSLGTSPQTGISLKEVTDNLKDGDLILQNKYFDIDNGETLTIPEGKTLTLGTNSSITNFGNININGSINIQQGSEIRNKKTITNIGNITNEKNGTITNEVNITNEKNGKITNKGIITQDRGKITNEGEITNDSGGVIANEPKSKIINNNIINNQTRSEVNNKSESVITNNETGTINNITGSKINNELEGVITNNQTINNETGSEINNNNKINNIGIINNNAAKINNRNTGTIVNESKGKIKNEFRSTINNNGKIENKSNGQIKNDYLINNDEKAVIVNELDGTIHNEFRGVIYNKLTAEITNKSEKFKNEGKIYHFSGSKINGEDQIKDNKPMEEITVGNIIYNENKEFELEDKFLHIPKSVYPAFSIKDGHSIILVKNSAILNYNTLYCGYGEYSRLESPLSKLEINEGCRIDNYNTIKNTFHGLIKNNKGGIINNYKGINGKIENHQRGIILNSGTIHNESGCTISNDSSGTNRQEASYKYGIYNSNESKQAQPLSQPEQEGDADEPGGEIINYGTIINLQGKKISNFYGNINNYGVIDNAGGKMFNHDTEENPDNVIHHRDQGAVVKGWGDFIGWWDLKPKPQ